MFHKTLDAISPYLSGANALDLAAHIHDLDRWSSFDKHRKAAQYCLAKMKEYGLEGEIFTVPADGETVYGDWIMPRAWDARHAELRVLPSKDRGETVLCSYRDEPCSLVIYSKPTPPGGVAAEVIMVDGGTKPEDYEGVDVRGKVLFTRQSARAVKVEAVKHGAVGVVSDHLTEYAYFRPPMELPDTLAWVRFSPDYDHGGWGMKKGDTECWGFVLSPRQGQWLRQLIAQEGTLRLHAEVDARFYDGEIDVVTGRIPGRTKEEVLMNGHLYEVGAVDDASGAAVAIEVLRTVNELIEAGKLRRPKRGIRMLFTYECMGTIAAASERRDMFKNIVAGVTLDCVGSRESLCRAPLGMYRDPHAQSSYTDTLLHLILDHLSRTDPMLITWKDEAYADADNMISDPTIGVPSPLLMECPYTHYHSSTDTPDKLDPAKLHWIGRAAASYVYTIASSGQSEAQWLAEEMLSEAQRTAIDIANSAIAAKHDDEASDEAANLLRDTWQQLSYLQFRHGLASQSVVRLVGRRRGLIHGALERMDQELAATIDLAFRRTARSLGVPARKPSARPNAYQRKAAAVVPMRLVTGGCRMARVPRDDRGEWEAMYKRNNLSSQAAFRAQLWADGKRTVARIEELVRGELGVKEVRLLEYFETMRRYGYVRLRKA